jgi:hypothetical protein
MAFLPNGQSPNGDIFDTLGALDTLVPNLPLLTSETLNPRTDAWSYPKDTMEFLWGCSPLGYHLISQPQREVIAMVALSNISWSDKKRITANILAKKGTIENFFLLQNTTSKPLKGIKTIPAYSL